MNKAIRVVFFLLFISVLAAGSANAGLEKLEKDYQHDMDIARLKDLESLGSLIAEYKGKTGRYPLVSKGGLPTYVYIATKEQQKYVRGAPPYEHRVVDVKDFIKLLEEGLGREVELPFDPQRVPVSKPNFYIYFATGGTFFMAVHLYNDHPFARKIGEHYYKVELTTATVPGRGHWKLEDLMKNPDYLKAVSEEPIKPGYVEYLRKKLREEGAF